MTGHRSTDREGSAEVQRRDQATINILPDDVFLEIFSFCRGGLDFPTKWWWKNLTDVCRRWRHIIFASPHFLDVQLECTDKTPTRTSLDIWPPFPISLNCYSRLLFDKGQQDNIVAALEHHDRVVRIYIDPFSLETFSAVIQKPFPVLKHLDLSSFSKISPVLDEEFLGGSVPLLRKFYLSNIGFPAFPKLALSCSYLSSLTLWKIPITGYISPEAMATCLATLPNLRFLLIAFQSPLSRPDQIGLPPSTRVILPALHHFEFKGVSEYLEDLVARIDAPKLGWLTICLFMDLMFNISQLYKFIIRTKMIRRLNRAEVIFSSGTTRITLEHVINLEIVCWAPDWQASSMVQVCSQLSPHLSHVEQFDIREYTRGQVRRANGIDPTQFLELFHHFPAVQDLCIFGELRPLVTQALQEFTGEGATEVLPSLRSLVFRGPSLFGSIQEDIQGFVTARQNSNHPVDVEWKE